MTVHDDGLPNDPEGIRLMIHALVDGELDAAAALAVERRIAADPALAALLHHDLLGSAMAETLAHGARLDARLQRQGFGRNTQCLVARRFRINHSAVLILFCCACPHSLFRRVLVRQIFAAGRLVVIRHPVSDQDLAARQERLARRAREHGSMYHI